MCTLNPIRKFFLIPALVWLSAKALALPGTASLDYVHQNTIQLNEISVPLSSKSISINLPEIRSGFGILAGINFIQQDFSNRNLTFKNNVVIPLSTLDAGERTTALVGLNYGFSQHNLSVAVLQDVKQSLFTSKKITLGYGLQLYQGSTQIKFNYSQAQDNQPLSYYIDPLSLQSKERATAVKTQIFSAAVQQLWSDRFKTLTTLSFKDSGLFRPDESQIKLGSGLVLTPDWTLKNEFGYATENKNQTLTLDRGYFESRWADTELNFEWSLDSFLIFGLSMLDETETDPRRQLKAALGTDEIALGIEQSFSELGYRFKIANTFNSEKQSATSLSGGINWNF